MRVLNILALPKLAQIETGWIDHITDQDILSESLDYSSHSSFHCSQSNNTKMRLLIDKVTYILIQYFDFYSNPRLVTLRVCWIHLSF